MFISRSARLFFVASTMALAGHAGTPSATAAEARDATQDSRRQVARAASSGPDAPKLELRPGRTRRDEISYNAAIRAGRKAMETWPTGPAPLAGALLPGHRIVAYYGNPNSKKMGVLGEYPEPQMLSMLDETVALWRKADPSTPVLPAIHLVTVVAQGSAGPDGAWRRRESPQIIEQSYQWAQSRKGLFFVDIQTGHSTLQQELPPLLKYLERPDVHLGIDPEFHMHHTRAGIRPSAKVGQMMASDVNYVIDTLDKLVREKNLPPKVLVVHRFRADMLPDAHNIKLKAGVQVVIHMDGWGPAWLKFDSYKDYVVQHPVAFTGFKFFYRNDTKTGEPLLTPSEVLGLLPRPLYVQYQ